MAKKQGVLIIPKHTQTGTVIASLNGVVSQQTDTQYTFEIGGASRDVTIGAPVYVSSMTQGISVVEGNAAVINVVLSEVTSEAVDFSFEIQLGDSPVNDIGSPQFTNDVTLSDDLVNVPQGVTDFDITINTIGNIITDGERTFDVALGGQTTTITITDDDTATPDPIVSSITSPSVNGGSDLVFTIALDSPAIDSIGGTQTLPLIVSGTAIADTDYSNLTASNGVTLGTDDMSIPAGVQTFTITANTSAVGADKSLSLTSGGITGEGTIVSGAAASVQSVTSNTVLEGEMLNFAVQLTTATTAETTLPFAIDAASTATQSVDYATSPIFTNGVTLANNELVVPTGVIAFVAQFATLPDSVDDIDETLIVSVDGISATGTITNEASADIPVKSDTTAITGDVLGMNYSSNWYATPERKFKDLMKMSSEFLRDETKDIYTFDANGWPISLGENNSISTILFEGIEDDSVAGEYLVEGRYVILYDGSDVNFSWGFAADTTTENKMFFSTQNITITTVSQSAGRIEFDLAASAGKPLLSLVIFGLDESNPVRNIRVVHIDDESTYETQPFTDNWLGLWNGVKVDRFMDLGFTNNSDISEWSDRGKVSDQTWAGDVPIEILLQKSEITNSIPWVCIPHLATDDYCRELFTLLKNSNVPKAIVELSNEVWNFGFQQAQHANTTAQELGLPEGNSYPNSSNIGWHINWYAYRYRQIMQIAEEVYGADRPNRLIRVIAGQSAFEGSLRTTAAYARAHEYADALASAPYIQGYEIAPSGTYSQSWTVDQHIANVQNYALPAITTQMQMNATVAAMFNLPLIAYEGGQHLLAQDRENAAEVQTIIDVNNDPRMQQIYYDYYNAWKAAGGNLFCAFASTGAWNKYGCWGLFSTPYQNVETSPKYLGLAQFYNENGYNLRTTGNGLTPVTPPPSATVLDFTAAESINTVDISDPQSPAYGNFVGGEIVAPVSTTTSTATFSFTENLQGALINLANIPAFTSWAAGENKTFSFVISYTAISQGIGFMSLAFYGNTASSIGFVNKTINGSETQNTGIYATYLGGVNVGDDVLMTVTLTNNSGADISALDEVWMLLYRGTDEPDFDVTIKDVQEAV